MSQECEGNIKTFISGEALAVYRRVKISGSTVVYADAGEPWIGTTIEAVAITKPVGIRLRTAAGTRKVSAAGTFSAGAELYGADDGQVDDAAAGQMFGIAIEAATAADDIIEAVPAVDNASPNYDITYGPVLADGSEQGTFETDTTQNYALGTKRETPDGEIYRYAKAGTLGVLSCLGAAFMKGCVTSGATSLNEAIHVTTAVGDLTITMEQASVAADAFKDGYCTIGGGAAGTERHRIVSNTASAATTNHVVLTLAEAVRKVWTAASAWVECMVNPWSDTQCIATAGDSYATFGGVPAVDADDGDYYWCQTKGILWIVPGGGDTDGPGYVASERTVYFVGDGSINGAGAAIAIEDGYQKAGEIVQLDSAAVAGPPYVRLQLE